MSFKCEDGMIIVQGLDRMAQFSRFHPVNAGVFLEGLVLAADLFRDKGALVLSTDTELSHDRFSRLLKMREANPKLDFEFCLKSSDKLLNRFRQEIQERMALLLDRRLKTRMFRDLAARVSDSLSQVTELALADPEVLLAFQQLRFNCDTTKMRKAHLYLDQALNAAMFSFALARSAHFREIFGPEKEKSVPLFRAALLHNFGAVSRLDMMAELSDNERLPAYCQANRDGLDALKGLNIGEDALLALEALHDYQAGRRDFMVKDDIRSAAANILVVVELFLRRESGLIGDPVDPRRIVDKMNVLVLEHQFNDKAVQSLTLSLNLNDIFDFYSEMERLIDECPYDAASPYPMTGFRSPTLYICRNRVTHCRYIELSVRAVKLILKVGDLPPGDYHRCKLLTPKLMDFYAEFYEEIKEETAEQIVKPRAAEKVATVETVEKPPAEGDVARNNDSLSDMFSQIPPGVVDSSGQSNSAEQVPEQPDKPS